MDQLTYRVILAVILIGFVIHRAYYTRKVQHSNESVIEQPKPGLVEQIANLLSIPALLATLINVVQPQWMSWSALPFPAWLRWLGVGIALTGFALLQWAQQALGNNWSDEIKLVAGQQVVIQGPYRWVRHPIYAAFLLILGSLLLISANWFIGGLWLALTAVDVSARIRTEEAMLLNRFGERYRSYMQRTGRLLPRIAKRRRTV